MTELLIVRHAQSVWNAEGRWQGWADPPLSAYGEEQAMAGSRVLGRAIGGFGPPDTLASSDLRRALQTAELLGSHPRRAAQTTAPPASDPRRAAQTAPPASDPGRAAQTTEPSPSDPPRAAETTAPPASDHAGSYPPHGPVSGPGDTRPAPGQGEILVVADLREYDTGDWTGLRRPEIAERWPEQLADWDAGRLRTSPGGEDYAAFVARLLDALEQIRRAAPGARVLAVSHGRAIHAVVEALGGPGGHVGHLTGWHLRLGRVPVLVSAVSLLESTTEEEPAEDRVPEVLELPLGGGHTDGLPSAE